MVGPGAREDGSGWLTLGDLGGERFEGADVGGRDRAAGLVGATGGGFLVGGGEDGQFDAAPLGNGVSGNIALGTGVAGGDGSERVPPGGNGHVDVHLEGDEIGHPEDDSARGHDDRGGRGVFDPEGGGGGGDTLDDLAGSGDGEQDFALDGDDGGGEHPPLEVYLIDARGGANDREPFDGLGGWVDPDGRGRPGGVEGGGGGEDEDGEGDVLGIAAEGRHEQGREPEADDDLAAGAPVHPAGVRGDGNALGAGAAREDAGASGDGEDAAGGLDVAGDTAQAQLLGHGAVAAGGVEHDGQGGGGVDAAADAVDGLVAADRHDGGERAFRLGRGLPGGSRRLGSGRWGCVRGGRRLGLAGLGGVGSGGAVHAWLPVRQGGAGPAVALGQGGVDAARVASAGFGEVGAATAATAGRLRNLAHDVPGVDAGLDEVGCGGDDEGGPVVDDGGEDQEARRETAAEVVGEVLEGLAGGGLHTGDYEVGVADLLGGLGQLDALLGRLGALEVGDL